MKFISPAVLSAALALTSISAMAADYPAPNEWAKIAVPFLLELGPKDNGKQLTVRG